MKKTFLLKTMLLLFALIAGVSGSWAQDSESVTFSDKYSDKEKPDTYNGTDFSITFSKGTNSNNAPQYYKTGKAIRLYGGNTMTVSSTSKTIEKIELSFASGEGSNEITASTGTYSNGTWTGSSNSITFTVGGTSGHRRVTSVKVTFEASVDPTSPNATISTTSLDFGRVNFGETKELTFTVTPTNLTSDLTITCNNNKYEVSPATIASTSTTAQTITVTAKPTALTDDMDGTITISGGGLAANKTVTLTTTVTDPNANDGSIEKPYTVAEAIEATPASGTSDDVYIKGIVSAFFNTNIVGDGSNYRYYISDDGTTENQLLVYKGKGLNNEAFENAEDLQIGDKVIILGGLTMYQNASEVAPGNYIVSLTRKEVTSISVDATNATREFVEGSEFNHEGVVVTATYDDNTTRDVTALATFSEPDMTQVGEKTVTVTFNGQTDTYSITIIAKPSHTATFSVNGTTSTKEVKEDATIDFPNVEDFAGLTCVGWTTNEIEGTQVSAPANITTTATMGTADVTYYAVFAASNGGSSETATLTANSSWNGYADKTFTDDKNNTWTANCAGQNQNGTYVYGLNASNGSYVESPEFAGNITEIRMYAWNGSSSATRTFYIKSTKESTAGDLGTISVSPSEKAKNELTATLTSASFKKFYLGVSAALSFHSISVTYSTETLTNYCTSIPTSATATIASSGYTTYCSPYDLSFEDVENLEAAYVVTTSTSSSAKLTKVTAVPAGTGVILKGTKGAAVTIPVAKYTGSEISNILVGTLTATPVVAETVYVVSDGMFKLFAGKEIPANKAYLPASALTGGAPSLSFDFGGETTGINSVERGALSVEGCYTLDGRRVAQPTKGLYIVNGRKVIIK